MLRHHPLDVLVVVNLENAPQLVSMAKSDLRFLPHPPVSCPAYNLGDRRQDTFCNPDNLRAEGSPNRPREITATVLPTVGARSRPRPGTRSRTELQLRFGVQPIENSTQTREVEQQCLPSRGLGYEFGIESRPGHEGEPDRAST